MKTYTRLGRFCPVIVVALLSATVYPVCAATLIAEYDLNEISGAVAHDTSGNGYDGALIQDGGGPTWEGGYLHFGANDDTQGCVEVSNFPNLVGSVSVEVRFRIADVVPGGPRWSAIVTKWNPTSPNCSWGMGFDSTVDALEWTGEWRPDPDDTGSAKSAADTLVSGQWYTAVGVFESNVANRLYLDGQLIAMQPLSQTSFRSTSSPLRIGNRNWLGTDWNPFAGDIDYVRIYQGVVAPVPEPSTLALLAVGLLSIGGYASRKRRQR